jgi:hypothetical protein
MRKNNTFSLIELILVVGLFSVVLSAASFPFLKITQKQKLEAEVSKISQMLDRANCLMSAHDEEVLITCQPLTKKHYRLSLKAESAQFHIQTSKIDFISLSGHQAPFTLTYHPHIDRRPQGYLELSAKGEITRLPLTLGSRSVKKIESREGFLDEVSPEKTVSTS